jgi:hypothetical protein
VCLIQKSEGVLLDKHREASYIVISKGGSQDRGEQLAIAFVKYIFVHP